MRTPSGHKVYAIAAEYSSASELYEAAKRVRDAGFKRWDVFSPFPIHGMDDAMGLGKSWLSGWVLFGGVTGLLTAAVVEFGPSSILYQLDVHGKPWNFWTVPAFFPIMFELTVLFGAFAAFFSMLGMNALPRWYHPMFNWERFVRVSNDGFFLAIESRDPRLPVAGTVPIGYEMPKPNAVAGIGGGGSPGSATPAVVAWSHPPASFSAGTDYYNTGKMGDHWGTGIPVPVTPELMERGQQRFNITCVMCHGATAAGNGITKQYGLATVVTLQDERIRKMSDGEIFNAITNGKNTMMASGPNIIAPDRWAIIAYLRALQRSQNATVADIPEDRRAELDKPASPPPATAK